LHVGCHEGKVPGAYCLLPAIMSPDHFHGGSPLDDRAHIAKAAGIIMLGNVISRLLGFVRDQVIAALFGLTAATDSFTVASAVPTMVYDLLISGAISAALIPVFTDYADSKDREDLSRVVSAVLSLATLTLAAVVAVLVILAPQLVDILGGGYDQEVRTNITYLVRLMLPSVLFMGTASILTAALYARRSFTLPAFSVAVYNTGIILGGLLLAGRLGVTALVVGVLFGAVLQVAIQMPALRDVRLRPSLDLSHPGVRAILKLYAPVAAGLVISNLGVIIDRNLASRTGEGSIAAMRFATTLVQFPLGLVATATSFAVLPTLARQATGDGETRGRKDGGTGGCGEAESNLHVPLGEGRGEGLSGTEHQAPGLGTQDSVLGTHHSSLTTHHSYAATLRMGMKMILVLIAPAAVGMAVLREPIVELLFQRGQFDHNATALTALAFLGYSPSIAFTAVDQLLIFAFYARKDTSTPVLVGVLAVLVYLVVALALIQPLGMLGLVLANSAQWISHALVLLWLMNRRVQGVVDRDLAGFLARVLGAALLMGAACQLFLAMALPLATTGLRVALLVVAGVGLGAAVYAAAVAVLRVREAREVWAMVSKRVGRG